MTRTENPAAQCPRARNRAAGTRAGDPGNFTRLAVFPLALAAWALVLILVGTVYG